MRAGRLVLAAQQADRLRVAGEALGLASKTSRRPTHVAMLPRGERRLEKCPVRVNGGRGDIRGETSNGTIRFRAVR